MSEPTISSNRANTNDPDRIPINPIISPLSKTSEKIDLMLHYETDCLDNTHKLKKTLDYCGLGDYDSYNTMVLDGVTAKCAQKYITSNKVNPKHFMIFVKPNYDMMNAPNVNNCAWNDAPCESNYDVEYMCNDICNKFDYEGCEIILIVVPSVIGGTSSDNGCMVHLLTKSDMTVLKKFTTDLREASLKEEKEKMIGMKKIMVYTNFRKGRTGEGAANMMMGFGGGGHNPMREMSDWQPTQAIRARSFDSVYLDNAKKQRLLDDLDEFLSTDTQEWYNFHDIPSKRSYLLYGPPGTGKTSTVKAIASKYNMSLHIMKLNLQDMDDMAATNLVEQLPPRSVLLIEDIDQTFNKHGETDNFKQSLTFSGLLNILDGVTEFNSQIIVMTTNNREAVNREALRIGRIDFELELGYMNESQVLTMLKSFYPETDDPILSEFSTTVIGYGKIVPVELQEVIIRCKNKGIDYIIEKFKKIIKEVRAGRTDDGNSMYR
jgi:predicted AAA+ superfamily ATPase